MSLKFRAVIFILTFFFAVQSCDQSSKEVQTISSFDIDGIYEYLPPLKGQSAVRNGRFVFLFGPSDDSGPMTSQAGTHEISGDTVKVTITYSNDPQQVGNKFWWRVKSWSKDTVTYEVMDTNGKVTGSGRSIRVSK